MTVNLRGDMDTMEFIEAVLFEINTVLQYTVSNWSRWYRIMWERKKNKLNKSRAEVTVPFNIMCLPSPGPMTTLELLEGADGPRGGKLT